MGSMIAPIRPVNDVSFRPSMDGTRGVACLIVLFFHAIFFNLHNMGADTVWLRGSARLGVWLFFVLSAFLLTIQLLTTKFDVRSIARYTAHRILRIVPLFVLAVFAYRAAGYVADAQVTEILLLVRPFWHLWTIPVEMAFYLVLPALTALVIIAHRAFGPAAGAGAIACVILVSVLLWPPLQSPDQSLWLGWYASTFGAGVLVAYFVVAFPRPSQSILRLVAIVGGLLIAAPIVWNKLLGMGDPIMGLYDKHFAFGPAFAAVVYSTYLGLRGLERPLEARWLVEIGRASYSIYVWHMLFVAWLVTYPFPVGTMLPLFVSIVVGYLCYWLLERPIFALRRMMFSARHGQTSSSTRLRRL